MGAGTVTGNVRWTDRLHSLQVEAPEVTFVAGQFGRLALPAPPGSEGGDARPAVFVRECAGQRAARVLFRHRAGRPAVAAPRGARAGRARLAAAQRERLLRVGEVPDADVLWCLATAPASARSCRSCARPTPWVRSSAGSCWCTRVRHANELAYRDVIGRIAPTIRGAFTPISDGEPREPPRCARRDGFRTRYRDGRLESRAGAAARRGELARDALRQSGDGRRSRSRRSPQRGMRRHRRPRDRWHVTVETYW